MTKAVLYQLVDVSEAETTMISKRYLLLLIIILAGVCFIFFANGVKDISIIDVRSASQLKSHRHKTNHKVRATIHTEGCTIPALDPMDESIKRFVEYPKNLPQCPNATLALLGKNRTTIWIKSEKYIFDYYNVTKNKTVSCCYRSFYRPTSVKDITAWYIDNRVKYDDCKIFNNTIEVKHEFVRVNCSVDKRPIYEQFYLFAPKKDFEKHGDKDEIVDGTGYNILVVGIDTVSRLNFLRTMPKTASYLNKSGAIEMLGYNKVGLNTFPNLVPMFLGVKETELNKLCYSHRKATFDNCPFVWEWYKQAGYYTAFAEDGSNYATFNYGKRGFGVTPTDYYTRTLMHESEIYVRTESNNLCMHDVYYYQLLLNYIEDITRTLKSKRLFGLFWETAMTHDHLNYAMRMDDDYVKMFTNLETSGYLNDTIVFFASDHGIRWGSIRSTKQGRLEESLPFLYLLTPPSFRNKYKKAYDNLKLNSGRLTTPFDVHETLSDLLDLTNVNDSVISSRSSESYASKRGISLFLSIPTNRTCHSAGIDDQWCTCRKEVPLAKDHPKVIEAAVVVVKMINVRLGNYSQCAELKLSEIIGATEIQVGETEKDEDTWTEYMITVQTGPSGGVFEAVLRQNLKDQSWYLTGAPSRLNQYGDQSRCVDDYILKNYCYCH